MIVMRTMIKLIGFEKSIKLLKFYMKVRDLFKFNKKKALNISTD